MTDALKPSLDKILAAVRQDLNTRRKAKTLRQQMGIAGRRKDYRDFGLAVRRAPGQCLRWIGEAKKASPSAGLLREAYDPVAIAQVYQKKGAAAISVLTEGRYFLGDLEHLSAVHTQTALPVLRKDFVIDEYQVIEAAASCADAILLIVGILSSSQIERFLKIAQDHNLACLVEVHTMDELNKALDAGALILGVNNRDLKTLETDLGVTQTLFGHIPKGMIAISESGFKSAEQIRKVEDLGLDAVLVGETLMRSTELERAVDELFGGVA